MNRTDPSPIDAFTPPECQGGSGAATRGLMPAGVELGRARLASDTLINIENSDMKPRHLLARIAAFVTAAVTVAMFLGPARADAAAHEPDSSAARDSTSSMAQTPGSRVDGWTNMDVDIGAFDWSVAEELGSRLDGWDTPEMDLNPSELWEAMAFGIGSILDGWANRDMDIGAFSSATTAAGHPRGPYGSCPMSSSWTELANPPDWRNLRGRRSAPQ